MKKFVSSLLSILVLLSISPSAYAASKSDVYTDTVTINVSEYDTFSPDEEIESGGYIYSLNSFKIVDENNSTFDIITEGLSTKDFTAAKTANNPDNETQKGILLNTKFIENTEQNRSKEISKTITYSAVALDYKVDNTYSIKYSDKETGQIIDAVLNLKTIDKSNSYWIKDQSINGSVTGYDALFYNLNNSTAQIPKDDSKPAFKGYENDILKSLSLNPNSYRIIDSAWLGNTYYNAEGILCRDCIYKSEKLVCDITANYSSNISLPDKTTYTAVSTYKDNLNSSYTIEIEYVKDRLSNEAVTKIVVSSVIGVAVLSALIASIILYLSKKKKAANKNEQRI